jgi:hypothetical protein
MTFEDDARSLEAAVARFISALLLRFIHCSIIRPHPGASVRRIAGLRATMASAYVRIDNS